MEYVLSLSYGKDSLACLGAIELLGWPLDRIVTADVWATPTIPADYPSMVEFKTKADAIIRTRWGIEVEHVCATVRDAKKTYESTFYRVQKNSKNPKHKNKILGFAGITRNWCNSELKIAAINKTRYKDGCIQYLGIAADEHDRVTRHSSRPGIMLPLVEIGWTEADCRKWCKEHGLLSPVYATATRGGCWFCHNQGVQQLRLLRKSHPDLWALLMKWDKDSPVTFKPGRRKPDGTYVPGHTVHDYDQRFALEDKKILAMDQPFRWDMMEGDIQLRLETAVR